MKERITKFGVWMRNGICFAFTWLMLLSILGNYILGQETMSVDGISKLFVFVTGGVFLFTILFSDVFFRKISFIKTLTAFMLLFGVYESICFYWMGIFYEKKGIVQWGIFAAIILAFYFVCIGIYHIYSDKKEMQYTHALQKYQEKKRGEN